MLPRAFTIGLGIAAIAIIIIYTLHQNRIKKKSLSKIDNLSNSNTEFYNAISNMINKIYLKDELENLRSFNDFEEAAKDKILRCVIDSYKKDQLNTDHKNNYALREVIDATKKIFKNEKIEIKFMKVFTDKIEENVKEAEAIEKDAEEYHKQFDEDPNADIVLHPAVASDEKTYDMEEKSIDELESTGTVEDV